MVCHSKHISYLYVAAIAVVATFVLSSCGGGRRAKAIKAYNIGEYDRAQNLLLKTSDKTKAEKAERTFYLAECYRLKGLYRKAISAYGQAIKNGHRDSELYYKLAQCQLAMGAFDDAEANFIIYRDQARGHRLEAEAGIASCNAGREAAELIKNYDYREAPDSGYVLTLAKPFNSKQSDYSPAFVSDDYESVYFTSMRLPKKRKKVNRVTGQSNSNIYMSQIDGSGDWTVPEPLSEPFGPTIDDGTPSLTADGKTMYFTRCQYLPNQENNAECYEVRRSGGVWGEPVRVIPGGDSTMMVAHPAISPDGMTLIFVSDRSDSRGGKDLYKSVKEGDSWGPAENLGAIINTHGDEMFPYVREDGTLYFASNGHVGFGGLDIYKATKNEGGRYVVVNMGAPINSHLDDFGIVFKGRREEGLLSSNRGNSKGVDNIYNFVLPEVILTYDGTVRDVDGNVPERVFVKIIGNDGTNIKLHPDESGVFGFTAQPNTVYLLQCGARGYINERQTIDTTGKRKTEQIKVKFTLRKR